MPSFTYTTNIPDENNNPSTDQPNMKVNTNSINSIIGVDHYSFGTGNDGYHNAAHFVARSDPAVVPSTNILYSKSYTPDTTGGTADIQLFSETAGGTIAQLTGLLTTNTATSDGWAWVGGILIQWGFVSVTVASQSGTVTFKDRIPGAIPFPNSIFSVNATLFVDDGLSSALLQTSSIAVSAANKTRFKYKFAVPNTVVSSSNGFYWTAIGN